MFLLRGLDDFVKRIKFTAFAKKYRIYGRYSERFNGTYFLENSFLCKCIILIHAITLCFLRNQLLNWNCFIVNRTFYQSCFY